MTHQEKLEQSKKRLQRPRSQEGRKAVLKDIAYDTRFKRVYAHLYNPDGTIIISATLHYILGAIQQRGFIVKGVPDNPFIEPFLLDETYWSQEF